MASTQCFSSLTRRSAGALLLLLGSGLATAQGAWPDRPVRIVVPYAAGGTTDFAARQIAQKVSEQTGKSFFVENKAGGAGTIGALQVAKSTPDGTTFLINDTSYSMLPALFSKLPWDHARDLVPVTTLLHTPVVLVVPANSSFRSLNDLVAYAQANPGKLNYGSGGSGSSAHLQGALFNSEARIDITHVPYKGAGEAMLGLVAGQVDVLITASPTALPQVKGGKARALAVTGAKRLPVLADVPTFAEAGVPGYAIGNWFGLSAPRGTDPRIIDRMHEEVRKALADPALRTRLTDQGAEPGGLSPAEFAALIQKETRLWTAAAQNAGLKPQ